MNSLSHDILRQDDDPSAEGLACGQGPYNRLPKGKYLIKRYFQILRQIGVLGSCPE